jgi:putative PIN family toxin of toxin-antitoxin system
VRLVLDTNVLFAAYISRGTCAALYEQILATETLITSEPILSEFEQALLVKARVPQAEAAAARQQVQSNAEVVQPAVLPARVCRDADDDAILGTAVAAGADVIVSGDKDLLVLRQYQGMPVLTPAQALARLHA